MPENTSPHPGSWIGDLGNEWKTAKPPEKVMIVLAIVATIGIALYLHGKSTSAPNQPGAASTSGLGGIPANFQQGGGGGGGSTGGGTTPTSAPVTPPSAPGQPTKAPVNKQPTTVTKTYAGGAKKTSAPVVYFQNQPVGYKYNPQSTYEVARGHATYGPNIPPTPPKPILRVTPAQTYLQVGNRKLY